MNSHFKHIIIVSFVLVATSCSKEVSQDELIKGAVAIKLDQWEATQLKECKEAAYVRAEDYVDSLLLVTSLETKLDTIPKPLKPVRPVKPGFKIKPDSVVVDPIYKKE